MPLAPNAVRRSAANSAADKPHEAIGHVSASCRGLAPSNAALGRDQKIAPSGLFEALLWNNMTLSIFGRTTLAIHRYSRFKR